MPIEIDALKFNILGDNSKLKFAITDSKSDLKDLASAMTAGNLAAAALTGGVLLAVDGVMKLGSAAIWLATAPFRMFADALSQGITLAAAHEVEMVKLATFIKATGRQTEDTTKQITYSYQQQVGSAKEVAKVQGELAAAQARLTKDNALGASDKAKASARYDIQLLQQKLALLTATSTKTGTATVGQEGASFMTASGIEAIALKLQSVTRFSQDAIMKVAGVLITYKEIGTKSIPAVTESVLNLAEAFGIDATQAARMFGEALTNPAQAMMNLRRLGIAFTDQQLQQIKALVASGQTLKAQALLMDIVKGSVGDLAKALGGTASGGLAIFGNQLDTLMRLLGDKFLPLIENVFKGVNATIFGFIQDITSGGFAAAIDKAMSKGGFIYSILSAFGMDDAGITSLKKSIGQFVTDAGKLLGGVTGSIQDYMSSNLTVSENKMTADDYVKIFFPDIANEAGKSPIYKKLLDRILAGDVPTEAELAGHPQLKKLITALAALPGEVGAKAFPVSGQAAAGVASRAGKGGKGGGNVIDNLVKQIFGEGGIQGALAPVLSSLIDAGGKLVGAAAQVIIGVVSKYGPAISHFLDVAAIIVGTKLVQFAGILKDKGGILAQATADLIASIGNALMQMGAAGLFPTASGSQEHGGGPDSGQAPLTTAEKGKGYGAAPDPTGGSAYPPPPGAPAKKGTAFGGSASTGVATRVAERNKPEIFIPSGQGRIMDLGGGATLNISIYGASNPREMFDQIADEARRRGIKLGPK